MGAPLRCEAEAGNTLDFSCLNIGVEASGRSCLEIHPSALATLSAADVLEGG